MQRDRFLFG